MSNSVGLDLTNVTQEIRLKLLDFDSVIDVSIVHFFDGWTSYKIFLLKVTIDANKYLADYLVHGKLSDFLKKLSESHSFRMRVFEVIVIALNDEDAKFANENY